eukprot:7567223-Karenia_brevis.AAC.1
MPSTKWYVVPPGLRQPSVKPDPEMPKRSKPFFRTTAKEDLDQGHRNSPGFKFFVHQDTQEAKAASLMITN